MRKYGLRRTVDVLVGLAACAALVTLAACAGSQPAPSASPQAGRAPGQAAPPPGQGQGRGPGMGGPNREMLFTVMDVDRDGYISVQEYMDFQNRDFTRRDLDADQRLSREEFTAPPRPPMGQGSQPGQPGQPGQYGQPGQAQGYPPAGAVSQ